MSLSPYSNSPVTACFVSVTSTAKGLSKSTFQKMKRGCSPDDKPNFSVDKRRRFFHPILSVLCCVYLFKRSCFLSSFSLMYINLDLSGVRTKTWWWWNICSEKPKSIGRATEKRRRRELGPKNGRPPRRPSLKGFPSVELRCCTLQAPRPSVLWKTCNRSCSNCASMWPLHQWHEDLSPCYYIGIFLIPDLRVTSVSYKYWENVLLWHFNSLNTFVYN